MTEAPQTLMEVVRYFADLDRCREYMRAIKWPDGKVKCPHCQSDRIGEITTRHLLRCKDCRKAFGYKVGTIFEDSPLDLDKWFVPVWCIANAKNGISSQELGRAIGVTQKTAWFMLHRIREAMRTGTTPKKPEGFEQFDALTRKLIRVSRKELEKTMKRRKIIPRSHTTPLHDG